jgi:hypothetical protein|tara:strand:- start:13765 stop:14187 length:423 start_codon:yes stop_codon:yes gene_type:complete
MEEELMRSMQTVPDDPKPCDTTPGLSRHDQFTVLELSITNYRSLNSELLDHYLDTGLDLAINAGSSGLTRLQESWLRRIYTTLRSISLDPECEEASRTLCFDALYQVFFALRHMYKARPGGERSLRNLVREMQFISHHLV